MATCANCGRELRPGAKFCTGCGAAVRRVCPDCGAELLPEDVFCPSCGASAGEGAAAVRPGKKTPWRALFWAAAAVALTAAVLLCLRLPRAGQREGAAAPTESPAAVSPTPEADYAVPDIGRWFGGDLTQDERGDTVFQSALMGDTQLDLDAYFAYLELLQTEYAFEPVGEVVYSVVDGRDCYDTGFRYVGDAAITRDVIDGELIDGQGDCDLLVGCGLQPGSSLYVTLTAFPEAVVTDGGVWDGEPPETTLSEREKEAEHHSYDLSRLERGKATPVPEETVTVVIEMVVGDALAYGTLTSSAPTLGAAMRDAGAIEGVQESWGFFITDVYGVPADADAGEYWIINKNGSQLQTPIDDEPLTDGDTYTFILSGGQY